MGVAGDVVEGLLVGAVGGPQPGRGGRVGVGGFGEPGPQEMVVGVGEQQLPGVAETVAAHTYAANTPDPPGPEELLAVLRAAL